MNIIFRSDSNKFLRFYSFRTVEEMQQELMDTQAKATKQDREISALKMKLEDSKFQHKLDVSKLKKEIAALEEGESLVKRKMKESKTQPKLMIEFVRLPNFFHPKNQKNLQCNVISKSREMTNDSKN